MKILMRNHTCLDTVGFLFAAALCLVLFFSPYPAAAADRTDDQFLTGYVASILERDMLWERDSYLLKIVNGVAVITLFKEDPLRREAVDKQLRSIDGLQGIAVKVRSTDVGKPGIVNRVAGLTGQGEAFPTGDLFRPLIADPKQPQFFVSLNSFESTDKRFTLASVGFGETFGVYRFFGNREGDGLQLNLAAGLFAQFNMNTSSSELINADYIIGIPITYRNGINSIRFRLYHQSSHLGDELLLGDNPPERVNLSYEALELIYSIEWRQFRVYGGGEYMIFKEPSDLKQQGAHWGIEFRGNEPLLWKGRPIVAMDFKSLEEHGWDTDSSIKAGLEFGHPNPGQRRLRLLAVWYGGFDPRGQFYTNRVEYFGMEVSLGF
jgi:hypothetical protein